MKHQRKLEYDKNQQEYEDIINSFKGDTDA